MSFAQFWSSNTPLQQIYRVPGILHETIQMQTVMVHHNFVAADKCQPFFSSIYRINNLYRRAHAIKPSCTKIMGKWSEIESSLKSGDDGVIIRTLEDIVLDNTKLDEDDTKIVITHCIAKLSHHDIKVRSNAVAVIAREMREDNTAMVYMVDDLGKALATPTLLDLKDSAGKGEIYTLLHKDLCFIIQELQKRFPGKLMPSFKPIAQYLVHAVASKDIDVCNAACNYWSSLKRPIPVPQKYMENWLKIVLPKLQKLVPYLMKALEYQQEHIDYIKTKTRAQAKDFRPKTSSKEMEQYVSKRSTAGLALETIFAVLGMETIAVFKLNLLARMRSDEWLQQEAATFALGLFTQVMGTPTDMQDCYGEVVNAILENFKSLNPLLRAISCFAMQNFVNAKLKGVKNPFSKTIKGALHALLDESTEVQRMGVRCLSSVLANSEQDLQPHAKRITEALQKAEPVMFGECRKIYIECVGYFLARMGPLLDNESLEVLFAPLMMEWRAIDWEAQKSSDPQSVLVLCNSLCMAAMVTREAFSKNNSDIFDKGIGYLSGVLDSANGHSLKDFTTTGLMVACLDTINAICQGQPAALPSLSDNYQLAPCVVRILTHPKFDEPVYQSAVATFGHLCLHHFQAVQGSTDDVLKNMERMLKSETDLARNSVWALAQLTAKTEDKNDNYFLLSNQLALMIQNTNGDATTVISAALSLTNIGVKWGDSMIALFIKDEIFLHLCGLLQTQFEVPEEKCRLFNNVNQIYSSCISKVNAQLWVHYCNAVAISEHTDSELDISIKTMLKEIRNGVGNTKWNKINTQLGKKASINLRKKYKLY